LFEGTSQRKPCSGFYRHFGNQVEARSREARELDDGIKFFNGFRWPGLCLGGRSARAFETGHIVDSLIDLA